MMVRGIMGRHGPKFGPIIIILILITGLLPGEVTMWIVVVWGQIHGHMLLLGNNGMKLAIHTIVSANSVSWLTRV